MASPTPPIFLCERCKTPSGRWSTFGFQGAYQSLKALEIDLEGIDVEEGIYRAFDAEGRVVTLRPRDSSLALVTLEDDHETLPTDLEVILRRDLAGSGELEVARDPEASLSHLTSRYEANQVHKIPSRLRAKIRAMVIGGILLAIVATFLVGVATVIGWALP